MPRDNSIQGHAFGDCFKRAVNPMIILLLLSERPKYTHELIQEIKERSNGRYVVPLLYPLLYRLQLWGYIEPAGRVVTEGNCVRNYYQITTAGGHQLLEMKAEYRNLCSYVNKFFDDTI